MRIPSKDVPQADRLRDVIRLVDAVGRGATTYQDMAAAIQKVGRQGRYYRRAAEILGFVHRVDKNHAMLTTTGWAVVNSTGDDRRRLVKDAVLKSDVFRHVDHTYRISPEEFRALTCGDFSKGSSLLSDLQ